MSFVASYLLCHHHEPSECRVAFSAWKGFDSPLRERETMGSCRSGDHRLWWTIDAEDADAALSQLPPYLATRTTAVLVTPVLIP